MTTFFNATQTSDHISVRVAAELLGKGRSTIYRMILADKVAVVARQRPYRVLKSEVARIGRHQEPFVTLPAAAVLIGMSQNYLYALARKGLFVPAYACAAIRTHRVRWVFRRDEVLAFQAARVMKTAIRKQERVRAAREREARRFAPPKGYITAAQAQELLGLTRQRVHQLLVDGRFPSAHKDGNRWVIREREVAEYTPHGVRALPTVNLGGEPFFSVAVVAKYTRTTPQYVYRRIYGHVYPHAQKRGWCWYVPQSDLLNNSEMVV
jgi:predicted DNA-binding transcriptional regulator AlpA